MYACDHRSDYSLKYCSCSFAVDAAVRAAFSSFSSSLIFSRFSVCCSRASLSAAGTMIFTISEIIIRMTLRRPCAPCADPVRTLCGPCADPVRIFGERGDMVKTFTLILTLPWFHL